MTNKNNTAWGYVRYSTDKQGLASVGRQVEAIERWAARFGYTLLGFSRDFELSRTIDHNGRPGLKGALGLVADEKIAVLVGESVSRLAGDGFILETIRRQLPNGARLATADETGDRDLDEDRQEFDAMFSRREIKQIRQRTKGALTAKKMLGQVIGQPPWGFRLKADGEHVVRGGVRRCKPPEVTGHACAGCRNIEASPEEQAVVARAKTLSDEGLSLRKIANQLFVDGIVGRTGRGLSATQVHRFLRPLLAATQAAVVSLAVTMTP
jgi:DNA invertase Pin-like site-specific DNA recombinase